MKEQIKLAAKLYQCNDTAKRFFKDEYPEKIKWYTEFIQGVMKTKGIDAISSVLIICKDEAVMNNGMAMMLFFISSG